MNMRIALWMMVLLAGCCRPAPGAPPTTFLADFERGLDAAYAAGDPKAFFSVRAPRAGVRQVADGRFGRGLFLDRNVREFMFGYDSISNFCYERGTVEFWFRPEHDSDYKCDDDPDWMKSAAASSFTLFSTAEPPYGYRLNKNQYNYLSFIYSYSYQTKAQVGTIPLEKLFWEKGVWSHFAVAWDEDEARLFINGRLIACADHWAVKKPFDDRFFLSGWGTFDDVRISDGKLYVSSFTPPDAPLQALKNVPTPPPPELTAAEQAGLEQDKTLFYADYSRSATAVFARGAPAGVSNRQLEFEEIDGARALRLRRGGVLPEATLGYSSSDNICRFIGTMELVARLASTNAWPAVLFDCSDLENPVVRAQRQGMRLVLKDAGTLEWQNLARDRVVASVSAPVKLNHDGWNRLGFAWRGSEITLLQDGRPVGQAVGVPLPYKLPGYFFIGSDSQGTTNMLEGWIKSVEIFKK